jgi:hypothetical protein
VSNTLVSKIAPDATVGVPIDTVIVGYRVALLRSGAAISGS